MATPPATGNFLSDTTEYGFTLEANAYGAPVPVVTKEVDIAVASPFLLTSLTFKTRGGQVKRLHHCGSCNRLLERDNGGQERASAGANEGSAYFQPAACLGQQGLGV